MIIINLLIKVTPSERDRYEQFLLQKATAFSEDAEIQDDELKALDEPDAAAFQEYRKTLDPDLGYVPKKRFLEQPRN